MRLFAVLQQLGGAGEWIRNAQVRHHILEVLGFLLVDNKAATDRVIHVARQRGAFGIERRKAHAVAVEGERLVDAKAQMVRLAKSNGVMAGEREHLLFADAAHLGLDLIGIDAVGRLAGEPEQHRTVGAVPAPGQCQRAVEVDDYARSALERAACGEPARNDAPRASARPYASSTGHDGRTRLIWVGAADIDARGGGMGGAASAGNPPASFMRTGRLRMETSSSPKACAPRGSVCASLAWRTAVV